MNEEEFAKAQISNQQQQTDLGFLTGAAGNEHESVLNRHLDAVDLLEQIEKLLMGFEYNAENGTYDKVMVEVTDLEGHTTMVEQGPIFDPRYVRITIGYLKSFLNPNTFLSYIKDSDQINAIMWDVNIKLCTLLHPLKKYYDPNMIDMIWAMVENPIHMALLRASSKVTLDALSKMQHSVEHIQANPGQQQQQMPKKEFKVFGF